MPLKGMNWIKPFLSFLTEEDVAKAYGMLVRKNIERKLKN
jgi:hypothetical protein